MPTQRKLVIIVVVDVAAVTLVVGCSPVIMLDAKTIAAALQFKLAANQLLLSVVRQLQLQHLVVARHM
jgi:hypothetical protein